MSINYTYDFEIGEYVYLIGVVSSLVCPRPNEGEMYSDFLKRVAGLEFVSDEPIRIMGIKIDRKDKPWYLLGGPAKHDGSRLFRDKKAATLTCQMHNMTDTKNILDGMEMVNRKMPEEFEAAAPYCHFRKMHPQNDSNYMEKTTDWYWECSVCGHAKPEKPK